MWQGPLFGVILVIYVGCSLSPVVSKTIVEQPSRLVRLDVVERLGAIEFSHPQKVQQNRLMRIFGDLTIKPKSIFGGIVSYQEAGMPAFTEQEKVFLAHSFARAFEEATNLERVAFVLIRSRNRHIREITSGGAYLVGTNLHLLVANYRFSVSGRVHIEQAFENPMKILGEQFYSIETHSGIVRDAEPFTFKQATTYQPLHLVFPMGSVLSHAEKIDAPSADGSRGRSVESPLLVDKMKTLERLRRDGLITEEEYEQKRKELLESL